MNGAYWDRGSLEFFAIRLPDANVSTAKELAIGRSMHKTRGVDVDEGKKAEEHSIWRMSVDLFLVSTRAIAASSFRGAHGQRPDTSF
jgi:hypothetical protein